MVSIHSRTNGTRAIGAIHVAFARSSRLQWVGLWSGLVLVLSGLLCVSAQLIEKIQAVRLIGDRVSELQFKADAAQVLEAPKTEAVSVADFIRSLADRVEAQPVLESIARMCARDGVTVTAIQIQPRPAVPGQLQRTDLNLSLRGGYANLKHAIADTLDTSRGATLAHLAMRRLPQVPDAEATLTLALWSKPDAATQVSSGDARTLVH